jgi:cyclopropane fatty-acyl-phospholipid synthase-like methyltransferase
MNCPLCHTPQPTLYHRSVKPCAREYWLCHQCDLVFVPKKFHVEPCREKAEYDLHQNVVTDLGYQRFLSKVIPYIDKSFTPNERWFDHVAQQHNTSYMQSNWGDGMMRILDFGCGPSPVLAMQLASLGYSVHVYDKYFAPFIENLQKPYDIIVSTEVVEHIYEADETWARFDKLITRGGRIVIMTKRVTTPDAFAKWHYIHDPTHICFYAADTAEFIANRYCWQVSLPTPDIMVFTKP